MTVRGATVIVMATLAILGAGLFVHTYTDAYAGAEIVGMSSPLIYPRVMLVAWVLLAVLGLIDSVARAPELAEDEPERGRVLLTLVAIAIVVATTLSMRWIGFAPSMAAAMLTLGFLMGYRRPVMLPLASIGFAFGIWYLFHHLLLIRLPVSPFLPFV